MHNHQHLALPSPPSPASAPLEQGIPPSNDQRRPHPLGHTSTALPPTTASSLDSPQHDMTTTADAAPGHHSTTLERIRHRRKMNKRRLRAQQAARTERLSDEVAALQLDIFHLEQHLLNAEQTSGSLLEEGMATREITAPSSHSSHGQMIIGSHQLASNSMDHPHDEGEECAIAEARLRRFVVHFQHGWTSDMSADLRHFVHDDVEVVDEINSRCGQRDRGLRGLERQWFHGCAAFRGFHMALRQLVCLAPPREWLVSIDLSLQLTLEAVELRYPHVIQAATSSSPGNTRASEIVATLTATPLQLDVQCRVWLDGNFKIEKFDVAVGWATALLACLGNPDDVVWVLKPQQMPQGRRGD